MGMQDMRSQSFMSYEISGRFRDEEIVSISGLYLGAKDSIKERIN